MVSATVCTTLEPFLEINILRSLCLSTAMLQLSWAVHRCGIPRVDQHDWSHNAVFAQRQSQLFLSATDRVQTRATVWRRPGRTLSGCFTRCIDQYTAYSRTTRRHRQSWSCITPVSHQSFCTDLNAAWTITSTQDWCSWSVVLENDAWNQMAPVCSHAVVRWGG